MKNSIFTRVAIYCVLSLLFLISTANAQGAPSAGSDMWSGAMGFMGLFTPHPNNCSSNTEAFVDVLAGYGYCIEKTERPPLSWRAARDLCLKQFKRLPEIGEFQIACDNATPLGLNNMIGNLEWGSNFPTPTAGNNGINRINVVSVGFSSCTYGNTQEIADTNGRSLALAFRCVR